MVSDTRIAMVATVHRPQHLTLRVSGADRPFPVHPDELTPAITTLRRQRRRDQREDRENL